MTDNETRAELERIDSELSLIFDRTIPVRGETLVDGASWQKALRLLAESQKALREIGDKFEEYVNFDTPDQEEDFLKCNAMINEIGELAKNACKEV